MGKGLGIWAEPDQNTCHYKPTLGHTKPECQQGRALGDPRAEQTAELSCLANWGNSGHQSEEDRQGILTAEYQSKI